MSYKFIFAFCLFFPSHNNAAHDDLLNNVYKNKTGFSIQALESASIENSGGNATYGEITDEGVQKFIEIVNPTTKDVFYDLGSGIGRMVTKMYLDSPVKKSVGIELSKTRHKQAAQVKEQLQQQHKINNHRILSFQHDDILKADLSDATIIYTASTCFSNEFIKKLTEKLAQLRKGLKIFTLRPLVNHSSFKYIQEFQLPMTWSDKVTVHWYELQ